MGKDEDMATAEAERQAGLISGRARAEWCHRLLRALLRLAARARRTVPAAGGYVRLVSGMGSSRRLSASAGGSRVRVARLGNKKAFRLRSVTGRLKWRCRWLSPLMLLARLRDTYVNLMLSASGKLATSSESLGGVCFVGSFPSHPFIFPARHHHQHRHANYHHGHPLPSNVLLTK
ncbi:hypothetical protein KP509_04G015200 [Ceratopteris richardii]|uniref:Uncharacterized protein n=1 Tax=Ceratopteris richardii TaxID=49495 RepID=A0A8T2UXZ9_CERRI|nr:hypothetical protein KP509_04G015200 [Ceratopteris richardii]